jgi:hypothetical protein
VFLVLGFSQCEGWKPIQYESTRGTGKALYGNEVVTFSSNAHPPVSDFASQNFRTVAIYL